MVEWVADSLEVIVAFAKARFNSRMAYRGVHDIDLPLVPRVARQKMFDNGEESALDHFRLHAASALPPGGGPTCDLEWLALGQHHGLDTRLTDWTESVLVATYFAVEDPASCHGRGREMPDAAVYFMPAVNGFVPCHRMLLELREDPLGWGTRYEILPEGCNPRVIPHGPDPQMPEARVGFFFMPTVVSPRMSVQSALLFLPRDPALPMDQYPNDPMARFRIPAAARIGIRRALDASGIHRRALFPDLDGIAAYANTRSRPW